MHNTTHTHTIFIFFQCRKPSTTSLGHAGGKPGETGRGRRPTQRASQKESFSLNGFDWQKGPTGHSNNHEHEEYFFFPTPKNVDRREGRGSRGTQERNYHSMSGAGMHRFSNLENVSEYTGASFFPISRIYTVNFFSETQRAKQNNEIHIAISLNMGQCIALFAIDV